jgi:rhodanese-related sulfurtransferase
MIRNIDTDTAKQHYDNNVEFLDVREQDEFDQARIPGSTLLPMSQMNSRWQEIPKDREMVVYCRTGNRSAVLLGQLAQMGYTNLLNLEKGIVDWHQKQYPVEFGESD